VSKVFIITYLPGLKSPIRAYKNPRFHPERYSENPNYQEALYDIYHHRILTKAEQKAFEEACPKVIQTYTKQKEEDLAPASGDRIKISEIFRFNRNFQIRLEDNRPAPIKSIKVKGVTSATPLTSSSTSRSGTRSGSLLEVNSQDTSSL